MTPEALDELLRANYSLVRAVCWRILHDDSDTDDATQNALISITRNIDSFDGRSSVSTWIYRIATNAALDELRRRRRRQRFRLVSNDDRRADPIDDDSQTAYSSIDVRDSLNDALAGIPEEFRVPLVLREVADLEYDEISRILGIPGGTVRSRIARGRARLAQNWAEGGGNQAFAPERLTDDTNGTEST